MKTVEVDVAVIGAGTSGMNARREVEKAGGKPLLIEADQYGTTCARVGCMPSKLLIAAANRAHAVASADEFGIEVSGVQVDGKAVMERVRRYRDRFAGAVVKTIEALPEQERLCGRARFTGPTTLEVDAHTQVKARAVVIATGASAVIPPPYDAVHDHVLTNETVFELEDLPATLAVVGTGIIGLELGQAFQRLGVNVTFFARSDHIGAASDPKVRAAVHDTFAAELDLRLNADVTAAEVAGNGIRLNWTEADGSAHEGVFEKVLVAAGRRPNLDNLNLAATGLELDERGRPPWNPATTQCGELPIFMAGDISGYIPLLHEASDEGRIAGANAINYPNLETHTRRTPLAIAFTAPQMAATGQGFADLDPDATAIGEVSFARQGRALVEGTNNGVLRVYGDCTTGRLIGAEMLAPQAEHLAHLLAWAIQADLSIDEVLAMPVYHPVLEEGMRTALRDLARQLEHTDNCRQHATAAGD
jgi:dihydrolipoamide dehydrogenase